ncbi:MAG: hypothetical protein EZS28_011214 [Streblomastix strix]|uniref:Uncharacterized protein n=1 Tax=Streblomastix strix TaxID=222440 RepID=A0A5J4WEB3_9EUKA|nr:MAG: hypothetical protein EZS28_011214 [Streblomastix strix]
MSQSDNHSDIIDYSDFLEILRIPFVGSETEKQNISKQQEDVCLKIITKLKDKTDDEGRESAINAGVAQELSYILESRNLSEVSLPLIEAFDCISFPGDKIDFRPIIYEKYDPFPGILRLIELQNNEMLRVVIKIIGSIINGGISDKYSEHPYYESIISINGGNKIFSLFQRKDVDNNIRNIAAISIGRLFKSQELPETMKQPIIDHLKSITSDQDYWTRSQSILSIDYLAQNEDNYTEIMKGFDKLAVAQDLLLPIIGNDEERKQIQHKKNLDFILLAILLDKEEEDEETILENLIEAGIFEALMYYFETQYLNMISSVSVKILDKIQSQAKELIDLLKQEKKYFPKILHLFGSSDIEVINAVYDLIAYDFAAGADLAEENSPNLLFEEISECGGIEIIFDLFQRNLNQKSRDDATNLLVMLFINQEFSNEKMRREIINFYKNSYINVEKLDLITRSNLIDIAKINGNHTEILKDNFITKAVQAISDQIGEQTVKVPDELRFSVIDELKQMSEYKNDKKIIRLSSIVLSMLAECEQNHTDIITDGFSGIIRIYITQDEPKTIYQGLVLILSMLQFGSEQTKQKVKQAVSLNNIHDLIENEDQNVVTTAQLLDEWLQFIS